MPDDYQPGQIEAKWRRIWERSDLYAVYLDAAQRPFYNLMEFPYPSSEGLHVGHSYTYGGADTYGRYRRMRGDDVFQPMGFDAFGIHSENYALKMGQNPAVLVPRNVRRFREEQLKRMGAAFNWAHQVDTSQPDYYRWTQWIFIQLYKGGLAYRDTRPVNWCPACLTTLADEQVIEGRCERCEAPVTQRELTQWFFRITDYADRLLDHSGADFPEMTRALQRNWIGRKEGAEIDFRIAGQGPTVSVFSTRADTLYGATFLALAPEHPLVAALTAPERRVDVDAYCAQARQRSEVERMSAGGAKTGVYTGAQAVHPLDGRLLPVWVADYVLPEVGAGAVFGTPGHDARDSDFGHAHGLPMLRVVRASDDDGSPDTLAAVYEGEGILINSGPYNGLTTSEGRRAIVADLAARGLGRETVSYRLHDWTISRQRYWGPPIPMIYCQACGVVPVPEEELPVLLPATDHFRPLGTGLSPLASIAEFVETTCPSCGGPARRETDVSDNFLDSAWYFLRYLSTDRHDVPWDVARLRRWLPVGLYFGGPEHSTMHHLYARFLWKALQDLGHLPRELGPEPFAKLRLHGIIIHEGAKMSKSRGNVINPDQYIARHGSDTLRLYMLFLGPFERGGDFRDDGINGMVRFLRRVWRLVVEPIDAPDGTSPNDLFPLVRAMHQAVRKVTQDIESLSFNTAIAALMTYAGELARWKARADVDIWDEALNVLLRLLAPFAPHIAEELWERCRWPYSVHRQPWPEWDEALAAEEAVTLVVQVDGRVHDRFEVSADLDQAGARELAQSSEAVQRALAGRSIARVIHVPGKLINLVTRG